ncbi:Hpt domain-containing protein [Pseudoalteromonas sp. NEC-BIFX-2020_002]|uniref:HPt domain-containing protein n=1 Tax=Pseudoalteromonas porphyrae TaxID=187330 RepID=A0A0N1ELS2_9GAMM|nr:MULTISPECIES: Hpt domain-containing protein [Pseudoalteromonas]KPH58263.1 hypothetical protein ADS77_17945 [Pseudoalteromonas porphyrae]NNG44926.1 Hpt domain-containing protein [Pseudoalteromonas sp. NEC-BIFX-2020_002]
MNTVIIDEGALEGMESLLGEQFDDTLMFCCAEFERLGGEILATIHSDVPTATRHAHSLKSNAAQFGASSLSDVARDIEQSLNNGDLSQAVMATEQLESQVAGAKEKLTQWLQSR